MRRFHFHIGSLLILVVILGVGFAALREAGDLWDSVILCATMVLLLASILLAVHRNAERRAFWLGFALFGWSYVGLAAMPSIEQRLLTTRVLVHLDSLVPDRSGAGPAQVRSAATYSSVYNPAFSGVFSYTAPGVVSTGVNGPGPVWIWDTTSGSFVWPTGASSWYFVRIGHSLCALILAWLGGNLSRHLHLRNRA